MQPYFLLLLAAIVAYLPVSFMLYSLKNDIAGLELPINYFLSECIHNGIEPFWLNTWAMGFPLEGIITWSIYSPVALFFCGLFHYSIYTLHIEFIFFIALCGWSFYYLLKKHFLQDRTLAMLLSLSYMLSGFNVASSQWLLYITAVAFLPLIVCFLLDLLKYPGWRTSLLFTVTAYTVITSVYAAYSVIFIYLLAGISLWHISRELTLKRPVKNLLIFLSFSVLLIILLSLPAIIGTIDEMHKINRGTPILANKEFFNSNYLHPMGLLSLAIPFSILKMQWVNTEPTMLNIYIGLLPLLLFPTAVKNYIKERNKTSFIVAFLIVIFLLISFGELTPIRSWLNLLPGFSYFRNAGLFRIFVIFFILIYIGRAFRTINWNEFFELKNSRSLLINNAIAILIFCLPFLVYHLSAYSQLIHNSTVGFKYAIQAMDQNQGFFVSAALQIILLLCLIICCLGKNRNLFLFMIGIDLVLNTLICTPYLSVSSYSVKDVNEILGSVKGFPVQSKNLGDVTTSYSINGAIWYNTNVYKKEVSSNDSYFGPLMLTDFILPDTSSQVYYAHPIVYGENGNVRVLKQKPNYVSAIVNTADSMNVYFLQNNYPGWKANWNGEQVALLKGETGGMKVKVKGKGVIEFYYERTWFIWMVVLIHGFVFGVMIVLCIRNLGMEIKNRNLELGIRNVGKKDIEIKSQTR
ncbi:MAG: YfhO family protein [Flavisolibacter sp.]